MIKVKHLVLFTLFLPLFLMAASSFASENPRLYIEGVTDYNNGDFKKSVDSFETIAASGVKNGKLFYNLGNAHFKAGNLGNSILWYERAVKMIPNDPDLKFNFEYAKGFVKDKSDEKGFSVFKILFFWKHLLGQNTIKYSGVALSFLFWIMIIFQMVKGRKIVKLHTGVVFTLAVIFILTASYDFYADRFIKKAVILPAKVSVRSGLTADSTELFILHVGTNVSVEDNRKGHVKIRFSDDKIGWIEKEYIEII